RDGRVRRESQKPADLVQQIHGRPYAVGGRHRGSRIHTDDAARAAASADDQLSGARSDNPARRRAKRGARCQGTPRHLQFIWFRRPERVTGHGTRTGVTATIRALRLIADRKLELAEVPAPPPPAAGEVQIAIKAVGLNHLDLWGFRGMAFAKRQLPLVV